MKCSKQGCFSDASCKDGCCAKHTTKVARKKEYSGHSKPRSNERYLGVELECFAPNEIIHKSMLAQTVVPHRDGSLPTNGCEFKFCREAKKAIKQVAQFASKLAQLGARVNHKCGLHVHLDARGLSREQKVNFVAFCESIQNFMFSIMPPSRRPGGINHEFCQKIDDPNYTGHKTWVNITRYDTVEIRIHGGTLNEHKMQAWLTFCADMMEIMHSNLFPTVVDGRPNMGAFSPLAAEYLLAREVNGGVLADSTTVALVPENEQ